MFISATLNIKLTADNIVFICFMAAFAVIAIFYLVAGYVTFDRIVYSRKRHPKSYINMDKIMGKDYPALLAHIKENAEKLSHIPHKEVFITSNDNLRLSGYLYNAPKNSSDTVICVHGYTSSGKNDFSQMTDYYRQKNYNMLLINLRAHAPSQGKYIGFGVLDRHDIVKWVDFVAEKYPTGNIFIHGMSMGAAASLMASCLDMPDNVKGIVADCAFTSPWDIFSLQIRTFFQLPTFPILNIAEFFSKIFAGYDFKSITTPECVSRSNIPTLFIHGSNDIFVPTVMSKIAYDACSAPKNLLIIEGAGHAGSYFKDNQLYLSELNEFLDKYSQTD